MKTFSRRRFPAADGGPEAASGKVFEAAKTIGYNHESEEAADDPKP